MNDFQLLMHSLKKDNDRWLRTTRHTLDHVSGLVLVFFPTNCFLLDKDCGEINFGLIESLRINRVAKKFSSYAMDLYKYLDDPTLD